MKSKKKIKSAKVKTTKEKRIKTISKKNDKGVEVK
jgi:hypothetical protein